MANESIFQHDRRPAPETATDAILITGIYSKELMICLSEAEKVMVAKNLIYGDSWKRRGGIGAFMMLARKWDRIEIQVKHNGYDVFTAVESDWQKPDNLLDDIRDLRNYLTLVEHEVRKGHGDFQGRGRDATERDATDNSALRIADSNDTEALPDSSETRR
jgi:hypothetical protein